jgi:hypothetical protein
MSLTVCPSCASTALSEIYTLPAIPVQSCILLDTKEEAVAFPQHGLQLKFCADCGFVFNAIFDEKLVDYASTTEESQHFSGTFNSFAKELVREIIGMYDLKNKHVLEIGCGKGDFLQELCLQAGCNALGVDPGFIPERLAVDNETLVEFQREYFDPVKISMPPDFVVCRHTLEHIGPVGAFIHDIHSVIADDQDVGIFFETPDVRRVLAEGAFWDIYFEHCSYFTAGSHARLFRREGLDVTQLYLAYDDQYIIQYARQADDMPGECLAAEDDLEDVRALAAAFPARVREVKEYWRTFVRTRHGAGKRVAIWGGGSKGVSFLTSIGLGREVADVVDINPYKQGRFLPVTGHRVCAPEDLLETPPDVVIVMNPIYLPEIGAQLESLGLVPELMAV